jgi:hypothetical protein
MLKAPLTARASQPVLRVTESDRPTTDLVLLGLVLLALLGGWSSAFFLLVYHESSP